MSFDDYYLNQAGTGIATYSGFRFQKGHGFFGRMIKGSILPLIKKVLPYLKDQLFDTGREFGNNIMTSNNFKEAAKKTAKRKIGDLATVALQKVKSMTQDGSGFNTCGVSSRKKRSQIGIGRKLRIKRKSSKMTRKAEKSIKKSRKKRKSPVKKKRKGGYKRGKVDMAWVRSFRGKKKNQSKKTSLENF